MTTQWAQWRLKSPVSRLFVQPFVEVQIIENFKTPRHKLLWGEPTDNRLFPLTKSNNAENVSTWWRHHDKVLRFTNRGLI